MGRQRKSRRVVVALAAAVVTGVGALPAAAVPYAADWGVGIGPDDSRGLRTIGMALGPEAETVVVQDPPYTDHVVVTRVTTTGLDPAFGIDGEARVLWDPTEAQRFRPEEITVQDDGRILVVGEIIDRLAPTDAPSKTVGVMRLLRDGSLDPGFDGDGRVGLPAGTDVTAIEAGQIDAGPNGRVVVATVERTAAGDRLAVRSLGSTGRPDKTFGSGGRSVAVAGGSLRGEAWAAIVSNGRIVTGTGVCTATACSFVAVRLTPKGAHDPAFGGDGSVEIALGPDAVLVGVHAFLSGEVLLVGWATNTTSREPEDMLVRLRPDGSGRLGFGTGGVVARRSTFGRPPELSAVQPDGKILLAGAIYEYSIEGTGEGTWYSVMARLHWNGARDTSFGTVVTFSYPYAWLWEPGPIVYGSDYVDDLAVRPNGDILELASWYGEHSGGAGLLRLVPS